MWTSRPLHRALVAAALAALLLTVGLAAPNPPGKGKKEVIDVIQITSPLNDYDTVDAPYSLATSYTTSEMNMQVGITTPGTVDGPKDAPPASEAPLSFTLGFAMDSTGTDIAANLQTNATPPVVVTSDPRYGITFFAGGMGFELRPPKRAKPVARAAKAAKPGDPIPVGWHYRHFPAFQAKLANAHARVLVQGRSTMPQRRQHRSPDLKTVYDLPADLSWQQSGRKWYPIWSLTLTKPLSAGPNFHTIMRPILLDEDGKIVRMTTHPY